MRRLWWLIPHLKIEMWGTREGRSFVGERGGRLRGASGIGVPSTTLRTGSSPERRAQNDSRKQTTTKNRQRQGRNAGILRCVQNDNPKKGCARMTS